MKTRFVACSLAAALAVCGVIATKAFAADNSGSSSGRAKLLQRIADKLNLTSDQRTQIRAILAGERNSLTSLLGAVHDARKNLREAIRANGATEASVRAASAKVAAAEADLAVERMKLYGKIAPILTDAQREQLAGLRQRADDFVDGAIARIGAGPGD